MLQVQGNGMGSTQGWVYVYHPVTGRLTRMQRAPAPAETTPYGTPDESLVKDAKGNMVPKPGASNEATEGQRVGPGVDRMEVQPGLRSVEMENQGYVPRWMEGPQGGEWVYDMDPNKRTAAVNRQKNLIDRRMQIRQEEAAGRPDESKDSLVDAAYRRTLRGEQARRDRVSLQQGLAGGQATAASRAAVNQMMNQRDRYDELLGRLSDPRANDWERAAILGGLVPNAQTANPTPLGRDAVGAANAMRLMNAEALAGRDPVEQEVKRQQLALQEASLPPDQKVALSRARGEAMGEGLSSGPLGAAWTNSWSEAAFRRKAEAWGYEPSEIDSWIDARRDGGDPARQSGPPVASAAPPPGPPGGPMRWPAPE